MSEENDYSEYLVLFDIPPSANALDVVSVFEGFGEIKRFCFVGKDFHVGRAFLKYASSDSREQCLQMSGYNNFKKPEFENINSSIYIKRKPIIVTPIQDKEAVLLRRKEKSMRNMNLLNIGNDIKDSIYKGEMELREKIIQKRQQIFFSDAEFSVSKRTLRFYNCPKHINKGLLREIFRNGVEIFVNIYSTSSNQERAELANQIDIHKIRITNVQFNQEDGSVSITFSNHYQAYAALHQLNGDPHSFPSFTPIIHFDLRKKILPFPGAHIIPDHPCSSPFDYPPPPPF